MATGKVKWFSDAKGYGFIQADNGIEGGSDVFVHYTEITSAKDEFRSLAPGQVVQFDLMATPKGFQAKNVERKS